MDPVISRNARQYIPIATPSLGHEERNMLLRCIDENWISQGKRVAEFESRVAKLSGKKYGSACNSGTTALHLALHVANVGEGNTVVIPDLTMIAVANSVLLTGASPIFADSSKTSEVGNISLEQIQRNLKWNTKAVIVVHTYGEPVEEIEEIADFCKKQQLILIEDCAESHFAEINGKPVGSFGDLAIFSFYSNKNITTGEGGMVITNSEYTKNRLDRVRMHAFTPGQHFCHTEKAFGYRMTDMQASIGLAQLDKANMFMSRRKKLRKLYDELLKDNKHFVVPNTTETSGYWVMPLIAKNGIMRDAARHHIANDGIDSRTYFQPMSQQSFLKKYHLGLFNPIANHLAKRGFYVPLYPRLLEENVEYICDSLNRFGE